MTAATETHRAIDAVWRIESARLIAGLARTVRDVGLAEELAQDALLAALEQWPGERIAAHYDALAVLARSPVVELNRAVAVGMAFGPEAGLDLVDQLTSEPALEAYHLLPSVRADLIAKLGRFDKAREELERAASLTRNERERQLLLERARAWAGR